MIFVSLRTVVASVYNEAHKKKTMGLTYKAHRSIADTKTSKTEEEIC
jgi:hypothetical protein